MADAKFCDYLAEVPLIVLLVMVLTCGYVAFSILVFWPSPRYPTRVEQAAQARPSNTKWLSKAAGALKLAGALTQNQLAFNRWGYIRSLLARIHPRCRDG
jgi:hypothetical protein